MKTKVVIAALLIMMGVAQVNASTSGASLKIVRKEGSDVFVVTYHTSLAGHVRLTIKDDKDRALFTESVSGVNGGFSLPVNLEDAEHGIYSVEVDNGQGKEIQTLDYTNSIPVTYTHVTPLGNRRYLLTVSADMPEKINIVILDGAQEPLFQREKWIDGNFSEVYELKNLSDSPTFVVTDLSGNSLVVQ
jgi:hypothetical protein